MNTPTGKHNARLLPMLTILAAGAGLIWIGWSKRTLWSERSGPAAPAPSRPEPRSEESRKDRDNAAVRPSPPVSEEEKIEQLLKTIERSGVIFIRNGSEYDGPQAGAHLRDKLRASGVRRPTLDDFIENVASRSSMTGQPYQVRLPDGRTVDAGPWLRLQCETTSLDSNKTSSKEGQ